VRQIGAIDLRRCEAVPARQVLILDPLGAAATTAYASRLRALGAAVQEEDFPGYDRLVCDSNVNEFPELACARLLAWLQATIPAGARAGADPRPVRRALLHPPGAIERPLRFGEAACLFGMLCQPDRIAGSGLAVLICNTGSDPHYGIGRLSVMLARRLAGAGVASLRLDFSGIGDSIGGPTDMRTHVYETARNADIDAALTALQGLGYDRFILAGVCSGAYHAFHTTLSEPRVEGLVMANLARFLWRTGDSVETVRRQSMRSTVFYIDGLKTRRVWRRMLRGDVNVPGIAWLLTKRLTHRIAYAALLPAVAVAERLGLESRLRFPQRALRRLARRGVKLLLVVGREDPGLDEIEAHFGTRGRTLAAFPDTRLEIVPDIDHMLGRQAARERFVTLFQDFLRDQYGIAAPESPPACEETEAAIRLAS
jgi:pimeloyl-ACP methyl ester carboxylesterase